MTNLKRNAYAIVRVSTRYQCDSLEAQTNQITTYCNRHPELLLKDTFSLQESAYCLTPQKMDKILFNIPADSVLLLSKVDRLTRNIDDFETFKKMIKTKNIEFHFITENIIWNKDTSRRQINNIGTYIQKAEEESLTISERTRTCNVIIRSKGQITYPAPFGYINYQEGKEKGWKPDAKNVPIVIDIFNLFSTGTFSYQQISDKIEEKYNVFKSKQIIFEILHNRFYIGYAKYKGEEYKHIYETFISEDLFNQCQEVAGNKNTKTKCKQFIKTSALYGLVREHYSNKLFSPYAKRDRHYLKSPSRGISDLKEVDIMNIIDDVLKEFNNNDNIKNLLSDVLNNTSTEELSELIKKRNKTQKDYDCITTRFDTLLLNTNLSNDMLRKSLDTLNKQINFYKDQLSQIDQKISETSANIIIVSSDLPDFFRGLSITNKSLVLTTIFKDLVVKDGSLTMCFQPAINHEKIIKTI